MSVERSKESLKVKKAPTAYLYLFPTLPRCRYAMKQWMNYLTNLHL